MVADALKSLRSMSTVRPRLDVRERPSWHAWARRGLCRPVPCMEPSAKANATLALRIAQRIPEVQIRVGRLTPSASIAPRTDHEVVRHLPASRFWLGCTGVHQVLSAGDLRRAPLQPYSSADQSPPHPNHAWPAWTSGGREVSQPAALTSASAPALPGRRPEQLSPSIWSVNPTPTVSSVRQMTRHDRRSPRGVIIGDRVGSDPGKFRAAV
jgi:hypothetical protein